MEDYNLDSMAQQDSEGLERPGDLGSKVRHTYTRAVDSIKKKLNEAVVGSHMFYDAELTPIGRSLKKPDVRRLAYAAFFFGSTAPMAAMQYGCGSEVSTETNHQCNDGIDNDGDGRVDYPEDPECTDIYDNDEMHY